MAEAQILDGCRRVQLRSRITARRKIWRGSRRLLPVLKNRSVSASANHPDHRRLYKQIVYSGQRAARMVSRSATSGTHGARAVHTRRAGGSTSRARPPAGRRCDRPAAASRDRAPPSDRRGRRRRGRPAVGPGSLASSPSASSVRSNPSRSSRAGRAGAGVRRSPIEKRWRPWRARSRSGRGALAAPRGASARPLARGSAWLLSAPGGALSRRRSATDGVGVPRARSAAQPAADEVEAIAGLRGRRRKPAGDLGAHAAGPGENHGESGMHRGELVPISCPVPPPGPKRRQSSPSGFPVDGPGALAAGFVRNRTFSPIARSRALRNGPKPSRFSAAKRAPFARSGSAGGRSIRHSGAWRSRRGACSSGRRDRRRCSHRRS